MLGAMLKMAKGATNPDALKSMLEAMGFKLDLQAVALKDGRDAFGAVAGAATKRGASLHRLRGTMKDGGTLDALIVLIPQSSPSVSAVTE